MKTGILCSISGLALSLMMSLASAQQPTTPPAPPASAMRANMHEHMQMRAQKMQERHMHMQARLKEALKLRPDQEAGWQEFSKAMQPAGKMQRPDRDAMALMSLPERMEKRLAMAEQHLVLKKQHLQAFKTFYATLTPDQQRVMERAHERMQKMRKHMKRMLNQRDQRNQGHQAHQGERGMRGSHEQAMPTAPAIPGKPSKPLMSAPKKSSNPE
jgi:hypothetical protein